MNSGNGSNAGNGLNTGNNNSGGSNSALNGSFPNGSGSHLDGSGKVDVGKIPQAPNIEHNSLINAVKDSIEKG